MEMMNLPLLWILSGICVLFALVFAMVWALEKRARAAKWAAYCFALVGSAAFLGESHPYIPTVAKSFSTPLLWLALIFLVQAFVVRQGRTMPLRIMTTLASGAAIVYFHYTVIDPNMHMQMIINSTMTCLTLFSGVLLHAWSSSRPTGRFINCPILVCMVLYILYNIMTLFQQPLAVYIRQSLGMLSADSFDIAHIFLVLITALALILLIGGDIIEYHRRASYFDPLTGTGNRRALDKAIVAHRREKKIAQAVLVVDLDHFKQINDRYGHAVGDAVLSRVGAGLSRYFADTGKVFRTGGEEFVVLFYAPSVLAADAAAQVRELIADLPPATEGLVVTASLGLAVRTADDTINHLFRHADVALYRAKADGRNRVVHWPIEELPSRAVDNTTTPLAIAA